VHGLQRRVDGMYHERLEDGTGSGGHWWQRRERED